MTNPEQSSDFIYVVITEADGPFDEGELLVCSPLPGTGVREIGYPKRKPLKWDCRYERFDDPYEAADRVEEVTFGTHKNWIPSAEGRNQTND